MSMQLLQSVEAEQLKLEVPAFGPGDTVRVHVKVVEGSRERIQVFEGLVIRRRSGGPNENFTVRRIAAHGIGVERTFLINSPRIDKIEVVRTGLVRRSKLYYLRGLTGRAARIRERRRPNVHVSLNAVTRSAAPVEAVEVISTESEVETEEPTEDFEEVVAAADVAEVQPEDEEADVEATEAVVASEEIAAAPDAEGEDKAEA